MDLLLANRNFVIVGGTAGMGYAAAQCLVAEGAHVAITGRDLARTEKRAASLRKGAAGQVIAVAADGTKAGDLERGIDDAAGTLGGLDGIAVTAGPVLKRAGFADYADEDWDAFFQNQLMLTVRACRAALPHLVHRGCGTIVTTSAYSIRAQKAALAPYTAMKTAIAAVTKNIAKVYGPQGVRANCICPGAIATEALDEAKARALAQYGEPADKALSRLMAEEWGMKVALGRCGEPHEVGELIAFLLSGRAAYMTGALINIDGGTDF